jgi:hypothetical protein
MNRDRVAPLCGVAFVVLVLITFFLTGQGQDPAKKTAQEVVSHYTDKDTQEAISLGLISIAGIFLLFFAGWIRQLFRAAEGESGMLSGVAFGALVVIAGGLGVGATIHLALIDAADNIDPVAVAAINQIDYDFFIPFAVGMATFLLAAAIVVFRTGALPRWLGWVAIVGFVVSFAGPAGFFGFVIGMIWILIVEILGATRGEGPATAAP